MFVELLTLLSIELSEHLYLICWIVCVSITQHIHSDTMREAVHKAVSLLLSQCHVQLAVYSTIPVAAHLLPFFCCLTRSLVHYTSTSALESPRHSLH